MFLADFRRSFAGGEIYTYWVGTSAIKDVCNLDRGIDRSADLVRPHCCHDKERNT